MGENQVESLLKNISLENNRTDLQNGVFGNSIIFKKLATYLHLSDLKCLRMTSHLLCNQVSSDPIFKNKVFVRLSSNILKDDGFQNFHEQYPKWNSFSVELSPTKETTEENSIDSCYLASLGEDLKHLKLCWKQGSIFALNCKVETSLVFSVLHKATNLRKLELEIFLLADLKFSSENSEILESLKNISDFTIFYDKSSWYNVATRLDCIAERMKFYEAALGQLTSFRLRKLPISIVDHIPLFSIFTIVKNNCSTLKSLSTLCCGPLNRATGMLDITCPMLKQLSLQSTNQWENMFIKSFLNKQPPLEEIEIFSKDNIDTEILSTIEQKHSKSLKTLHIKAKGMIVLSAEGQVVSSPFQFLKSTELLDFALVIPTGPQYNRLFGNENCEKILECLPSSIQKLKMRGASFYSGTANLGNCLCSFSQLTNLTLIDSDYYYGLGADDDWKLIGKSEIDGKVPFPNINTLELFNRFKFSGENLKDLLLFKGLRKLRMSCSNLTDNDVRTLKFNELQSLDISGNSLSQEAIQQMVTQNPSLEVLRCSQRGILREGRLKYIEVHDPTSDSDSDAESISPEEDWDEYGNNNIDNDQYYPEYYEYDWENDSDYYYDSPSD